MPSWFPQNVPESKHVKTYEEGFTAGLEAGAQIVEIICERFGEDCEDPKLFRMLSAGLTAAIRAHAREEKATP